MAQVIVRLERAGKLIAYAFDSDIVGERIGAITPAMLDMLPALVMPLVEGVLFGLRHGPLQSLLRKAAMPKLDAYEQAYARAYANAQPPLSPTAIKNAATLDALARVIFQTLHEKSKNPETGELTAVDIRANDLSSAAANIVTRVPEWDADVEEQNVVESDGSHVLQAPSEEPTSQHEAALGGDAAAGLSPG